MKCGCRINRVGSVVAESALQCSNRFQAFRCQTISLVNQCVLRLYLLMAGNHLPDKMQKAVLAFLQNNDALVISIRRSLDPNYHVYKINDSFKCIYDPLGMLKIVFF